MGSINILLNVLMVLIQTKNYKRIYMKVAVVMRVGIDHELMRVTKKVEVLDAPTKESENLDFFYKEIGCNMIDAVSFDAGQYICDDEGLLKSDLPVFEHNLGNDYKVPLAGNIVAYKRVGDEGETIWFDAENDIDEIMAVIDIMEQSELLGVTNNA